MNEVPRLNITNISHSQPRSMSSFAFYRIKMFLSGPCSRILGWRDAKLGKVFVLCWQSCSGSCFTDLPIYEHIMAETSWGKIWSKKTKKFWVGWAHEVKSTFLNTVLIITWYYNNLRWCHQWWAPSWTHYDAYKMSLIYHLFMKFQILKQHQKACIGKVDKINKYYWM